MLASTAALIAVADPPLRARIQSTDSHKDSEAMRKPRVGSRNMTSNAPAITPPAWIYVADAHVAPLPGLRPPLSPVSEATRPPTNDSTSSGPKSTKSEPKYVRSSVTPTPSGCDVYPTKR